MEHKFQEKIEKILSLSQQFQGIINEKDNDKVIETLNTLSPEQLSQVKIKLEGTNKQKINIAK